MAKATATVYMKDLPEVKELMRQAADEIERLRDFVRIYDSFYGDWADSSALTRARTALGEIPPPRP